MSVPVPAFLYCPPAVFVSQYVVCDHANLVRARWHITRPPAAWLPQPPHGAAAAAAKSGLLLLDVVKHFLTWQNFQLIPASVQCTHNTAEHPWAAWAAHKGSLLKHAF